MLVRMSLFAFQVKPKGLPLGLAEMVAYLAERLKLEDFAVLAYEDWLESVSVPVSRVDIVESVDRVFLCPPPKFSCSHPDVPDISDSGFGCAGPPVLAGWPCDTTVSKTWPNARP